MKTTDHRLRDGTRTPDPRLGCLFRPEMGDQRIQLGDGGRREGGDLGSESQTIQTF